MWKCITKTMIVVLILPQIMKRGGGYSPPKSTGIKERNSRLKAFHSIWGMSWENRLKVFVIVTPKEGSARMAAPILLLVWHWLFLIGVFWLHWSYSLKLCAIPKEGWAPPCVPILALSILYWGVYAPCSCHKWASHAGHETCEICPSRFSYFNLP